VLTEIRQCYKELENFWVEEISRAIEALKTRRVDPTDFERWKDFHASLQQTIESWKVQCSFISVLRITNRSKYPVQDELPSGDSPTLRCNNACSSKVCPFLVTLWHSFKLTVHRELTLGRQPPPCHLQ
jgi:hypothetical protein